MPSPGAVTYCFINSQIYSPADTPLDLNFCQLIYDKLQYLRGASFPKTHLHFLFFRNISCSAEFLLKFG